MSPDAQYPASVEEVLDQRIAFEPEVLRCIRRFARSRPWRGSVRERQDKFRRVHAQLASTVGVTPPHLIFVGSGSSDSGQSCYIPSRDTIVLHGLSVVTFLHEWGHRLHGSSERKACRWSINLFRMCFPRSFARCEYDGHMLRRSGTGT